MKMQRLLSLLRQAIDDYDMIEEGDRIAVGISGGKDSLALLSGLARLRSFYPKHFDIVAITVDLGFGNMDLSRIEALCRELSVEYVIEKTEIGRIIFEERQEENPCALCSKMRKGAFNIRAAALGCNKIAYAHHRDDVVETLMLSLIHEGRFMTFEPKTKLDRSGLTLIRPLLYVRESEVIGFTNKYNMPVCKSTCPADGHTSREDMKLLLNQLNKTYPGIRERIFHAICDRELDGFHL